MSRNVAVLLIALLNGCGAMPRERARPEPIYLGPDGKPRTETAAEWQARQPAPREQATRPGTPALQIGASRYEAENHPDWGRPIKVNTTVNSGGSTEQWVYRYNRYLYLRNGRVFSMDY